MELLSENEEPPLSEVASRCYFHNYNYFITVFTREIGCSPGVLRSVLSRERKAVCSQEEEIY